MTFPAVRSKMGRPSDPWLLSISVNESRMSTGGTTIRAELRLGRKVLHTLGVQQGDRIRVGIGEGGDAGFIELKPGGPRDQLVMPNGSASYRVQFSGRNLADEAWPCVQLEIIDLCPGRVLAAVPGFGR